MPWTPKQVRYLFSKSSPLSPAEKNKMEGELHANPGIGHKKKKPKKFGGGPFGKRDS